MPAYGLTPFDAVVIAVVVVSALLALAKGGVREVLSLASWVGAAVIAFHIFPAVQPRVRVHVGEPFLADVLTLAGCFLVPLVLLKIAASLIGGLVAASPLGGLDRLAGLAFGAVRGVLLVAVAYLAVSYVVPAAQQPPWILGAHFYPQVRDAALVIERALPERARLEAVNAAERAKAVGELGYDAAQRQLSLPAPGGKP